MSARERPLTATFSSRLWGCSSEQRKQKASVSWNLHASGGEDKTSKSAPHRGGVEGTGDGGAVLTRASGRALAEREGQGATRGATECWPVLETGAGGQCFRGITMSWRVGSHWDPACVGLRRGRAWPREWGLGKVGDKGHGRHSK